MVGDGKNSGTFMGALISKDHLAKVKGYVNIAREEGASILCGDEDLNLPDSLKNVRTQVLCLSQCSPNSNGFTLNYNRYL